MKPTSSQKNSRILSRIIIYLMAILIGIVLGLGISFARSSYGPLPLLLFLLWAYCSMLLHILLHETGHLLCGLLTGYRFVSFRVFSWVWIKKDGRIRCRRHSLPGTAGQCLMGPPDLPPDKMPYVLYHLGGGLANLLISVPAIVLAVLFREIPFVFALLMIFGAMGTLFAITNLVPLNGKVANDGMNLWMMRKHESSRRALWVQLKVNEQLAHGLRLRDMDAEWFHYPPLETISDSITAFWVVCAESRFMDEHRFAEAEALIEAIWDKNIPLSEVHRRLILCDQAFCALLAGRTEQASEILQERKQQKFLLSMPNFPMVLRTQYAFSLLAKKDAEEARKFQEKLDLLRDKVPNQGDWESERELLHFAEESAEIN